MRPLRWIELVLATVLLALLMVAAWWHPVRTPAATANARPGLPAAEAPVDAPGPPSAPSTPAPKQLLDAAADRHHLDRSLVEAVAYWESGWDQSRVSVTGAVGLMQVQPVTAAEVGPGLDVRSGADNAELGVRVLGQYLQRYGGDQARALAAYYQGPGALDEDGPYPDTRVYVYGIETLASRFARGERPPPNTG